MFIFVMPGGEITYSFHKWCQERNKSFHLYDFPHMEISFITQFSELCVKSKTLEKIVVNPES